MVPLKVHKERDTRASLISHLLLPLVRHVQAQDNACSSRGLNHRLGMNGFPDESDAQLLLPRPRPGVSGTMLPWLESLPHSGGPP